MQLVLHKPSSLETNLLGSSFVSFSLVKGHHQCNWNNTLHTVYMNKCSNFLSAMCISQPWFLNNKMSCFMTHKTFNKTPTENPPPCLITWKLVNLNFKAWQANIYHLLINKLSIGNFHKSILWTHIYVNCPIVRYSSWLSRHTTSVDFPDSLMPFVSIIHHF